ncbi:hypothetical protein M2132_000483 [Dysgonomonas sp. PH5-45]|uniref:glycosyltransferase family 1 protein n=1 Tax=unclassified Dysgonomonas TaxID=2630389 RepID=UPI002475E2AE|nr:MULTISPECIES: glycosyltransferase family 1 protein [unclassified Dysgonomonas]MDH6354161.1 hypothetical protein [Dysgonomonas sp. PH5-45]MDH6386988.1 hypothetical protein [Dysgonomonas sp. PH5-37]
MKILLVGEYSNLHWTLAKGLRQLGHDVTIVSDGDAFKNYPRDIDIAMHGEGRIAQIKCMVSIMKCLPKLKGFDIVQIINPCFTRIHPINIYLYRYLKKNNGKIFLGAFGDDYYYTKACIENKTYRYSEYFADGKPTNLKANAGHIHTWMHTYRKRDNEEIAETCNGIIACLCEYYMAYEPLYKEKLEYIPLPIDLSEVPFSPLEITDKIRFFHGINKGRAEVKGTAFFLQAFSELEKKYGEKVELITVESVAFDVYKEKLKQGDVVLDQVYSYSPAMNGLLTMASGKILVCGAEPEMYAALDESQMKPVVAITPSVEVIYNQMEKIVLSRDLTLEKSSIGRKFVAKHHDFIKIASHYVYFWSAH